MEIYREKFNNLTIRTNKDYRGNITKTVYFEYRPIVAFAPDNLNDRRLAAVQLVELGYCDQQDAAEICDLHRNTVSRLIKTKNLLGIQAIFDDDRGPKSPHKYNKNIRRIIKQLLQDHPDWTDQQIVDASSKELEISVSRSAVARIRVEEEKTQEAEVTRRYLEKMAELADRIDHKIFNERQLVFDFDNDPGFKEQVEQFSQEQPLEIHPPREQEFAQNLHNGKRNVFAGMLLHNLFLNQIDFANAFDERCYFNSIYDDYQIFQSIFYGLQIGLQSIESHKLINSSDLGLLLGRSSSPDEKTIRLRLKQISEYYSSEKLIDHFANLFLRQELIDPEVFFIDGHFLPYYGIHLLSKGYHTVRRLAMKGNEIYVITDIDKKPLFFITENCEIDFRPIIERAAEKLIDYGISRPLLVFDRGGYGIHFFSRLSKKADFITWAKYFKEEELLDIEYTSCIEFNENKYLIAEKIKTVSESPLTAKKEGRKTSTSLEVRVVIFKELNNGKPIPIYTSNRTKPAGDIVYYMLNRWGDSENFLKEITSLYNFDYHPGYDIKALKEQPLIINPEIKIIKKNMKGIKQKIGKLVVDKNQTEIKLRKRKDVRLEKKCVKIQAEIDELTYDLNQFTDKLSELPDKISIIDYLKGKLMSRANLERKKLYDLMQMIAYHSREFLIEKFSAYYKDKRDIKRVFTKITKLSGYVRVYGKTLVVLLDWIEDKKHRDAAINFCHAVNKMCPKLVGQMNFNLFFKISAYPQMGVLNKFRK